MGGKKEQFRAEDIGPATLIHTVAEPRYASEDGVTYGLTTEYLFHEATRQVIQRVFSSCKNTSNPDEGWERRLFFEKIVASDKISEKIRKKIRQKISKTQPKY